MVFFSVILCCFNETQTLRKAINSILNQSYSNYELIIVDDCSQNKNTKKILTKYKNHPKIKLFSNNINLGLTKSLNKISSKPKKSLQIIKNLVNLEENLKKSLKKERQ